MKPTRSWIHVLYACALLAGACGGGPSSPVDDPSTFAGMNKTRIENDCEQTRLCKLSRNEAVEGDFTQTCVAMEANTLNSMPQTQPQFLSTTNRCGVFTTCDYWDCTQRHPSGYGEQQMASITYACQQKTQCALDQGRSVGDPNQAVNNCVGAEVGTVFNFGVPDRMAYESAYAMCSAYASCDFAQCFPY